MRKVASILFWLLLALALPYSLKAEVGRNSSNQTVLQFDAGSK